MTTAAKAWSWHNNAIVPDHASMTALTRDWEYAYACKERTLSKWLQAEDWWVLSDDSARPRWFLLPVYHPTGAFVYKHDVGYARTQPKLRRMIQQAASTLHR